MVSFQETSNKTPVSERQNSLPMFPNAKNLLFHVFCDWTLFALSWPWFSLKISTVEANLAGKWRRKLHCPVTEKDQMLIQRTAMSTAQHRVSLSGVQLWNSQDTDLCWSVEQTGVPILSLPVCLFPTPAPLWGLHDTQSLQLCPILCDPVDYSPPGSSVHGIFQARILEWVAMASSRGSSRPRDWTQVSCTAGGFFTIWAIREA